MTGAIKKLGSKWRQTPITAKASLAYTASSIIQKSLAIITMPIFTRLLTQEQYGQFGDYTAWQGILAIFITLNLPYGSFSKAMLKFENAREKYIASCQTICAVLSAIFMIMYIPLGGVVNDISTDLIGKPIFKLPLYIVAVMTAYTLMQTAILLWNGRKRFEYKYKSVVVVTLITAFASPVLAYILVINTEEKGYARIVGYAVITILIGFGFLVFNYVKSKSLFDAEMVRYALRFNLPLIMYYLSQTIFNMSDRIMIGRMCGDDKEGIYTFAYSLAVMLVFVLNAINGSYVPWLYEKMRAGDASENKRISFMVAIIMGVPLIGIIWAAPEIVLFMGGQKYMEAIWVIPPVTMSNIFLLFAQYCINIEFYYEKRGYLVAASVGSAVLNIGLNAALIPVFGYIAAGYTTLASYVVFFGCNYIAMKKIMRKEEVEDNMYDYRKLAVFTIAFTAITALAMALYEFMIIRGIVLLAALVLMVIKRKQVIKAVKTVMGKG